MKKGMKTTLGSVLLILLFTQCMNQKKVDLIVRNATIYTVDGEFSKAEAMAIDSGKIVAVGPEHEILNEYISDDIEDAQTRIVLPGLIDAHCHFIGYGLNLQKINLVGTFSFEEVVEKVCAFDKERNPDWLLGRGWDQNDWEVQEFPTKEILDSLFPEKPVFLTRIDGHAVLVNQKALDIAGVTEDTQIDGGILEKIDGKLTGILVDNAIELVSSYIPATSEKDVEQAVLDAQKDLFAQGVTTVNDAGLSRSKIELLDKMHKSGQLQMRVYAMVSGDEKNRTYYLDNGKVKTDYLNVCSFKFYADGALGSRGARLIEPYSDVKDEIHQGVLIHDSAYFHARAEEIYEKGFQMNTHCIGDAANRMILQVYGQVLKGTNDRRWKIEHAQVVNSSDFNLFKKYNVIPSVQPTHATSDMYWAHERLGEHRVKDAYAYNKLKQQIGMIALGTDFPIEDISAIKTFYAAVVRKDAKGYPKDGYQMEDALSREDALRGMTIWAAISNFEENEKGSLEVGKFADFVILDRDIMTVSPEDILKTQILKTYSSGKLVFDVNK